MSSDSISLDLRLRFLEAILLPRAGGPANTAPTTSLTRRVANLNEQLDQAINAQFTTEAVRRFVKSCKSHLSRPSRPAHPPPGH